MTEGDALATPSVPATGATSPGLGASSTPNNGPARPPIALDAVKIPEGYTLNAVAVSQYCFKHGRVTVVSTSFSSLYTYHPLASKSLTVVDLTNSFPQPPRIAFIASGFGSRTRWDALHAIRAKPNGAARIKDLMRGGWRDLNAHPEDGLAEWRLSEEEWLAEGGKGERKEDEGFWDWKAGDSRGRKAGEEIRTLREVMSALGGVSV